MIPYHKPMKLNVDFSDIFESGIYTNADYCRKLEKKMSEIYNCRAIVCSSGSAGLLMALYYWFGDKEIITLPAFNWFSDDYIIKLMNIEPSYEDIDCNSWLVKKDCNLKLHTFGNFNPYGNNDCIYDATHSLGSRLDWLGKATIISFAPTKLVTAGEGGVILTNENFLNNYLIEFRDRCFRMSEFHAKIGLEYLKHLDEFLSWKKKVFEYYQSNINGQFQQVPVNSNYNTIGFLNLKKLTISSEIETKQYYKPLASLENTNFVYNNIVCLPSWFGVDYKRIVELIEEANK